MNEREKQILYTIISHYIKTGESVGSRTIEKKYDIGVSSATIRNTMSDLEDKGLIEKTHSSSGRIPTESGYKLYIDDVMYLLENEKIEKDVNSYVELKTKQLGTIIKKITELVGATTNLTVVSLEPSIEKHSLTKVEMVHINEKRAYVVAVTDLFIVKTANISFNNYTSEQTVKEFCKYINKLITESEKGFTLKDLKTLLESISYIDDGFSTKNVSKLHMVNETSTLLHLDDLLGGIEFIENKENFKNILKDIVDNKKYKPYEIDVLFGSDLGIDGITNLSFLFSVYEYENERGVICIIGSRRMDYKKNIKILQYANDILRQSLANTYNIKLIDRRT